MTDRKLDQIDFFLNRLENTQWYLLHSCLKSLKLCRDFRVSVCHSPSPTEIENQQAKSVSRVDSRYEEYYSSNNEPTKTQHVSNILQRNFLEVSDNVHVLEAEHTIFSGYSGHGIFLTNDSNRDFSKRKSIVTFGQSTVLDHYEQEQGQGKNSNKLIKEKSSPTIQLSRMTTPRTIITPYSPGRLSRKSNSPSFFRDSSMDSSKMNTTTHLAMEAKKRLLKLMQHRAISIKSYSPSETSSIMSHRRKELLSPNLSLKSAPTFAPFRTSTPRDESCRSSLPSRFQSVRPTRQFRYSRRQSASEEMKRLFQVCTRHLTARKRRNSILEIVFRKISTNIIQFK